MGRELFDGFLRWLRDEELKGRPDRDQVARALTEVVSRIVEEAGDLSGRRVLDLGSGTGAVALAAADRGAEVVALDLDGAALSTGRSVAARLGATIRYVRADARRLPFAAGTFDASLHRSVLVSIEDPGTVVAAEREVLRPGGRVTCSETLGRELDLRADDPSIGRVWHGLQRVLSGSATYAFARRDLAALYVAAGFDDVHNERSDREVVLGDAEDVARAFVAGPPAGWSARATWERSGVPGAFLDEFLARLVLEADRGRPAVLIAPECFLTARAPR